jgi:hypothetical protein
MKGASGASNSNRKVASMKTLSMAASVVLVLTAALVATPAPNFNHPASTASPDRHSNSSRIVRLTLTDGSTRTVPLEGVGCRESICSRVVVDSHTHGASGPTSTELDTVSAITNIRDGNARFVFRDGTMKQLSVVPWHRVLYVRGDAGREKIDLARLEAVEFLATPL